MTKDMLRIEELAILLQCSVNTIDMWYRFKKNEPDNEFAKMLPEYIQRGERGTRYWKQSDVWKFLEFRASLPIGCKGVMGKVTQKYVRKEKKNAKKTPKRKK